MGGPLPVPPLYVFGFPLTGSPPSKVYGHMRAIANRTKERL